MSIADFFHGLGEIAVAGLCDFATDRLGLEKPDEGSYLSQLYEEEQKHAGNILQHLSGDKLFRLQPGTPVYCNLAGGLAEHSGICIGRKIVHLDGSGNIICTSPKTFILMWSRSMVSIASLRYLPRSFIMVPTSSAGRFQFSVETA